MRKAEQGCCRCWPRSFEDKWNLKSWGKHSSRILERIRSLWVKSFLVWWLWHTEKTKESFPHSKILNSDSTVICRNCRYDMIKQYVKTNFPSVGDWKSNEQFQSSNTWATKKLRNVQILIHIDTNAPTIRSLTKMNTIWQKKKKVWIKHPSSQALWAQLTP